MVILDTNVISSLMRKPADKAVLRWLDQQPRTSVWITAVTMLEIRFGLEVGGRWSKTGARRSVQPAH